MRYAKDHKEEASDILCKQENNLLPKEVEYELHHEIQQPSLFY